VVDRITADSVPRGCVVRAVHHVFVDLVHVLVWAESIAQTVDQLHNPKGYLISATHLKTDDTERKGRFPLAAQ
jgi:hypothetical protein